MRIQQIVIGLGAFLLGVTFLPAFAVAGNFYSETVTASSPLSYWRFDDSTLQTAADQLGNNDGTYYSGVSQVAGAPVGDDLNQAASFDGSSGYIDIGTLDGFGAALDTGVTVEMWVKSSQTSEGVVFGLGGANPQFFINLDEQPNGSAKDDYIRLFGRDAAGNTTSGGVASDTNLTDGIWHYVAITYVGQKQTSEGIDAEILVYMATPGDVAVVEQGGVVWGTPYMGNSSDFNHAAFIGALNHSSNGAGQFFTGAVDELAVYDRALTSSEINSHFLAASAVPEPSTMILLFGALATLFAMRRVRF